MLHLLARVLAWLVLTPLFLLALPRPWLIAPGNGVPFANIAQHSDPALSRHAEPPSAALPRAKLALPAPPLRAPEARRVITVELGSTLYAPQLVQPVAVALPAAPAPPATANPAQPSAATSQVNTDLLNLRSGPGQAYPVAAVADFGTLLTVVGRSVDCAWLQVRTASEVTGWVVANYVSQSEPCDQLPVAAAEPAPATNQRIEIASVQAPLSAAVEVAQRAPATLSTCAAIPNEQYDLLPIEGTPTDRPAAQHPDLNLAVRSYEPTQAELAVIEFDAADDLAAPQLRGLFGDRRTPALAAAYQVYDWDWGCNCRAAPLAKRGASLAALTVQPGEHIYTPDSGRGLGSGYEVLVLYATENQITLKYTREDNVVSGYTLHLADLCVEPRLLALYQAADQAGRGQLPALRAGQAVGQAAGAVLKLAIRDTGDFMDPRDREDWWRER